MEVSGLPATINYVEAGQYHTCVQTATGVVKCWGNNFDGQLGNGEKRYRENHRLVGPFPPSIVERRYAYADPAHPHAATAMTTGESYQYDLNGNMIQRVEDGLTL